MSKNISQQLPHSFVGQGTSEILIEPLDHQKSKMVANLKLDPVTDILQARELPCEQYILM